MASVSDILSISSPVEDPVESKPKRRSSIFRWNETAPSRRYSNDEFPPDYVDKLLQENIKWQEAYNTIKSEYLELKKKTELKTLHVAPTISFTDYETYLKKTEDFCCQINNIVEMHENARKYQNMRTQELIKQIELTSRKIYEKLNIGQPENR